MGSLGAVRLHLCHSRLCHRQVGMSIQGHDASQRSQGFLCLFGGLIIAFAKEILSAIGAV
jgi:hypothetical protein